MSLAEKWATVALVIVSVATLWDLIDPRAMEIQWNNAGRLLLSLLSATASLVALLLIVGATAATCVIVVLIIVVLGLIRALADG